MERNVTGAPLVSVLMTSYNYERYLPAAIESVLTQEGCRDFELIIVDDFSLDGSRQIIEDAASRDGRVKPIFHSRNMGIAASTNDCINAASGQFMILMSSDDMLKQGALSRALEVMESRPDTEVLIFDGDCIDRDGKSLGHTLWELKKPPEDERRVFNQLLISNFINPAFMRTEAVRRKGIQAVNGLAYLNDWIFWLDLAATLRFSILREALYMYRIHGGNTSYRDDWMIEVAKGYSVMAERYWDRLTPSERSRLLYFKGISLVKAKHYREARPALLLAIKSDPVSDSSLKAIAMFAFSLFGRKGENAINAVGKVRFSGMDEDMAGLMERHRGRAH